MRRPAAFIAIAAIAVGQPSLAAVPEMVQAAVQSGQGGAAAASPQSGRDDKDIRGALFASSMAGALDMAAASHKQKETQRRTFTGGTAEAALLAGAGLLSPASHLLPLCDNDRAVARFDCQIVGKIRDGR